MRIQKDSREDFVNSWLNKSFKFPGDFLPEYIFHSDDPIIDLGGGFFKKENEYVEYYWYTENEHIMLAIELLSYWQSTMIYNYFDHSTPDSNVHMVDLYKIILKNDWRGLRLLSEEIASDYSRTIWTKLLNDGHPMTRYVIDAPGATMQTIETVAEMEYFLEKMNYRAKHWEYIVNKDKLNACEIRNCFLTRHCREINNML